VVKKGFLLKRLEKEPGEEGRMVRKIAILACAAAVVCSLVAAGTVRQLVALDNGKTFAFKVGETFEVVLEQNPSTGYTWQMDSVPTGILKQVGEPTFVPKDPKLLGSPGKVTFRFQTVAEGQGVLKMILHRKVETNVPPDRRFQVTLSVQK
jgi:inhibitor of cysteine peptidase